MAAENENLRTASLYINNQLLSRGLLRDGQAIDFTNPEGNEGGAEAAMGRIMSIVNDLILRRDRDAEQRESLSATLRTLRAENLRYAHDIDRLTEKHAEARRKLEIAQASEAAARSQLKSAEAAVRGLKEEMARAKTLVAQTRASCATEVRRRDRQIDGLKKQLGEAGRARGVAKNPTVTVINVVAGVGEEEEEVSPPGAGATAEPGYDLRSETNGFLTELARNLSEENETLLALVRRTLAKLRQMGGWQDSHVAGHGDGHALTLQTDCAELESEMEAILEQIRTILTNPSFVPIEEVEVREEEINKLRDGWVKMETRWQEAVHLIDGWRKRMAANGKGVNMEELNMSLRLSPVKVRDVEETNHAAVLRLSRVEEERTEDLEEVMPLSARPGAGGNGGINGDESLPEQAREYDMEAPDDDCESSTYEDEDDLDDLDDLDNGIDDLDRPEPNVEILQKSTAYLSSSPLPPPPKLSPLKDSSSAGNRRTRDTGDKQSKPRNNSTTVAEENIWDLANDDIPSELPSHRTQLPRSPQKMARPPSYEPDEEKPWAVSPSADSSLDDILLVQSPSPSGPPSPSPAPRQRPPRHTETRNRPKAKPNESEFANDVNPPSSQEHPINKKHDHSRNLVDTTTTETTALHPPAAAVAAQQQTPSNARPVSSRLPLPRPSNPPPQQSPLTMATIAAKLAASEREADAARVRAKLKAARGMRGKSTIAPSSTTIASGASQSTRTQEPRRVPLPSLAVDAQEDVDPVKRSLPEARCSEASVGDASRRQEQQQGEEGQGQGQQTVPKQRKREKRVTKTASRRRSTLSPWEMQSLISGDVPVASPTPN
ncbi:hypothetical protein ACRALDRAFT_2026412 [Sodiomyces alcalophilus JCM 7366]|uniref:uncharacterized protein n=1 Tax=Sodiomyces alcalophilus JCM 7366 TaxID=591952 RepID=UPI0039B50814